MRAINVLLGSADRQVNNTAEAVVLDVCYDQALVEFTRLPRLFDVVRQGCYHAFDLIIVAPNHLAGDAARRESAPPLEDVLRAIANLKTQTKAVVLALGGATRDEQALREAGVDSVVSFPITTERLGPELRRLLGLEEWAAAAETAPAASGDQWPFARYFLPLLERLKNA